MDKVALVTGANRGIGREVAGSLAERGWTVFAGSREPDRMQAGDQLHPLRMDLTDPASLAAAARTLHAQAGRLDLVVNNAAVLLDGDQDLLNLDLELLRRTLETNLLGSLAVAQAFVSLMGRGGRIVTVSSGGGQLSAPSTWSPAYCLSKTALNGLTVQLAEALRPRGIAVNAVCPGWVRTDMGGPSAPRSLKEGAAGILWLALDAPPSQTGGFFRDGKPIPW